MENTDFLNVFIVHYKKLTERKKYLKTILEQINTLMPIKVHFFEDIDRDTLSEEHLSMYKYDPQRWSEWCAIWHETSSQPRELNKAEIACAVTHLEIYKYIQTNGIKKALILEDDCVIKNSVEYFVSELTKIIKELDSEEENDFDLCWISDSFGWTVESYNYNDPNAAKKLYVSPYLGSLNQNVIFDDKYVYPMPCNKTTDAYLISNKAASFLLKEIIPFTLPIDWNHTPLILCHKLKNYWSRETLISQGSVLNQTSSTKIIQHQPNSQTSSTIQNATVSSYPTVGSITVLKSKKLNEYKPLTCTEIKKYKSYDKEYNDTVYQKLEKTMSDDLQKLKNMIITGENFALVKFGDGEFRNMISKNENDHNCDGCNYFDGLGTDLINSYVHFLRTENVFINRWPSHVYDIQKEMDNAVINEDKIDLTNKFVYYDLLTHKLPFNNSIIQFFKAIKYSKRYKIYVSNEKNTVALKNVLKIDESVVVPERNSYLQKEEITRKILRLVASKKDAIVLFSVGMFAKVLIRECLSICNYNTYVDIGSTFDGLHKYSRDYNCITGYGQELLKTYENFNPEEEKNYTDTDNIYSTKVTKITKERDPNTKYNILFEGWINIPHSYAIILVNKIYAIYNNYNTRINMYVLEKEYYNPEWKKIVFELPSEHKNCFDNVKKVKSQEEIENLDLVYSVSFPYDISVPKNSSIKKCIFYTSEFKLLTDNYFVGGPVSNIYNNQLWFTGPSKWSIQGLKERGLDDIRNRIISHGVDEKIFYNSDNDRKSWRKKYDIKEEDIVLLNIGSMTGNKNIQSVIISFFFLILNRPNISFKLILKGSDSLYGSKKIVEDIISGIKPSNDSFNIQKIINERIVFIFDILDTNGLRSVYNGSDIYVGPYLAEGFSLTHLEALFCKKRILVPSTGSTEDYVEDLLLKCPDTSKLIYKIPSVVIRPVEHQYINNISVENIANVLIKCVDDYVLSRNIDYDSLNLDYMYKEYSWSRIANKLFEYFEDIINC